MDDRTGIALRLEALGWITAADDHPDRAATLLGAAQSIWDALLTETYEPWKGYHDACVAGARSGLGPDAFDRDLSQRHGNEGNVLPLDGRCFKDEFYEDHGC